MLIVMMLEGWWCRMSENNDDGDGGMFVSMDMLLVFR